jgi:hypothetical protein
MRRRAMRTAIGGLALATVLLGSSGALRADDKC